MEGIPFLEYLALEFNLLARERVDIRARYDLQAAAVQVIHMDYMPCEDLRTGRRPHTGVS